MKSLKQIREEYNNLTIKHIDVDNEIMLEAKLDKAGKQSKTDFTTSSPQLLIFRRMSYKIFPGKQIVALYYARNIDKYLSVPFGPGGNVNLSEAMFHDNIDENTLDDYHHRNLSSIIEDTSSVQERLSLAKSKSFDRDISEDFKNKLEEKRLQAEGIGSALDTAAEFAVPYYSAGKKLYKGDYKGAAKDAAIDTAGLALGGAVGKIGAKIGSKILSKVGTKAATNIPRDASAIAGKVATKGAETVAKKPSLASRIGGALGTVGKKAAEVGGNILTGMAASDTSKQPEHILGGPRVKAQAKTMSASQLAKPAGGAVEKSKMTSYGQTLAKQAKQAALSPQRAKQQVAENKMTDLRKMVNENIEFTDININGRTVTLNTGMAKRILEVYDSVNVKNKKIVESMLNSDMESFKKLLNFSIRK